MWITEKQYSAIMGRLYKLEKAVAFLEHDTQFWLSPMCDTYTSRIIEMGSFRHTDNILLKDAVALLLNKMGYKLEIPTVVDQPKCKLTKIEKPD